MTLYVYHKSIDEVISNSLSAVKSPSFSFEKPFPRIRAPRQELHLWHFFTGLTWLQRPLKMEPLHDQWAYRSYPFSPKVFTFPGRESHPTTESRAKLSVLRQSHRVVVPHSHLGFASFHDHHPPHITPGRFTTRPVAMGGDPLSIGRKVKTCLSALYLMVLKSTWIFADFA